MNDGNGVLALGVVGMVLYGLTAVLYLVSGLVVPFPWLIGLWVVWLVGAYVAVLTFRRRRPFTPLLAAAAVVFWWLYVTVGESLFGWTA
ncbi:MAG: hypothetical protein WAL25_12495 [Acidimicrobiia bacterium]